MAVEDMSLEHATTIPVLCRFWKEDDVWNAIAEDLAVAVFGKTFEEATANLREALQNHLNSAFDTGLIGPMLAQLDERARELRFWSFDEVSPGAPIVKMLVGINEDRSVALM